MLRYNTSWTHLRGVQHPWTGPDVSYERKLDSLNMQTCALLFQSYKGSPELGHSSLNQNTTDYSKKHKFSTQGSGQQVKDI